MREESLFRQQVIDSRRNKNCGGVFINTPLHYRVMAIFSLLLMTSIILFIIFGSFSEKYIVKGYLNSSLGTVSVYPERTGVIEQTFITLGDKIKKGDVLYSINTSFKEKDKAGNYLLLSQLKNNRTLLDTEIDYKNNQLIELAKLVRQHYISKSFYHQKQEELINLKHRKNSIDIEIIKYNQEKQYLIRSPIDGEVAGIMFQQGQTALVNKPLTKLIPQHSELVVELFVPVKHAGFLEKNNPLIIRYDTYPYEHFGTAKATLKTMSRSMLTDNEEDNPFKVGEPYYKVIATLEKQTLHVHGKEKDMQQGMTLTAVIVGSKRNVWQWLFMPIYSFYGDLAL